MAVTDCLVNHELAGIYDFSFLYALFILWNRLEIIKVSPPVSLGIKGHFPPGKYSWECESSLLVLRVSWKITGIGKIRVPSFLRSFVRSFDSRRGKKMPPKARLVFFVRAIHLVKPSWAMGSFVTNRLNHPLLQQFFFLFVFIKYHFLFSSLAFELILQSSHQSG